jgi:hypothetical protein
VFISSSMLELADLRSIVQRAIEEIHLTVFVYEKSGHAGPGSAEQTSLMEVESSDLLVALFSRQLGEVTEKEFRHARALNKPCFVYVDQRYVQDAALREFLEREVYPSDRGVSSGAFNDAVQLATRIARDLVTYLSMVYRQSWRTLPAGLIPDAHRLVWDVEDWYTTVLGSEVSGEPAWVDHRTIDIPIRRNVTTETFEKTVSEFTVTCVAGHVDFQKDARALADPTRRDRRVVISNRDFSAGARQWIAEQGRATAMTFDELLDRTVRFEPYLQWLERRIDELGINRGYIPLRCAEFEGLDAPLSEHTITAIDHYVDRWLDDPEREHLSVLGQFGTGKTWCVYHTAGRAIRKYREAVETGLPRPRIPLVIQLRDFAKAAKVESLFSEFFFREHDVGITRYDVFQQLNRMGKLLLLFDGFDEMSARVDMQQMIDNFWEFARVLVPRTKAILTCRTEHFPEIEVGRALLNAELRASTASLSGVRPQFEVVELQHLRPEEVAQLLSLRGVPEAAIATIMAEDDLLDLARRPLMIEYILEALPEVVAGERIDLSRIYLYATVRKMDREIGRGTLTSLADKLYFLCELSWEMMTTDQMSLHFRAFPDRLQRMFDFDLSSSALDHWRSSMASQTMLVVNARGEYAPAHRSLAEFFAAYKFVASMGVMDDRFVEPARQQSGIDDSAEPKDYSWSEYFRRQRGADGTPIRIAPLRQFETEGMRRDVEWKTDPISTDRLTRNALVFAAHMISADAATLEQLCRIAMEGEGELAWNAIVMLPFLKRELREQLAATLVQDGTQRVRSGVAWVLGELNVRTPAVFSALDKTVTGLAQGTHASQSAWWEAGFALEKLGRLGPRQGRQGAEAIRHLARHLPEGYTPPTSVVNLRNALQATTRDAALVSQCDVVAVTQGTDAVREAVSELAGHIDLGSDKLGRRSYFMTWLCGHLGLRARLDAVLRAIDHPFSSVRNCACEALGKIGDVTPPVVHALEKTLSDRYYRARYHAAWSSAELGVTQMLPALVAAARREEVREVRDELSRAIEHLRTYQASART